MSETLQELVDVDLLQDIQDRFAKATGVAALIADATGKPITNASNFTKFCQYIRSSDGGLKRCILSDERVGNIAATKGSPVVHRCHSGLIDFAAPIMLDNIYLGSFLCGQILVENENDLDDIESMQMDLSQINLDYHKLTQYFNEINVGDKSKINTVIEMLFLTTNYIIKIANETLTQKELNDKSEKLMEQLNYRLHLEKILHETQLKVLQSQVNPHFLFNTLNAISRIAYKEKAEQTQSVTYTLGKILRYSLRNIDQLVPLEEELDHVKHYLEIQQVRFRDKINCIFDIDDRCNRTKLPIFTLQPIIENSIVHGFEENGKAITISVKTTIIRDELLIEITDTGAGIPPNVPIDCLLQDFYQQKKGHTNGIGLKNIDQRLKHYFNNDHGIILMKNRAEGGFCLVLKLPFFNEEGTGTHEYTYSRR